MKEQEARQLNKWEKAAGRIAFYGANIFLPSVFVGGLSRTLASQSFVEAGLVFAVSVTTGVVCCWVPRKVRLLSAENNYCVVTGKDIPQENRYHWQIRR